MWYVVCIRPVSGEGGSSASIKVSRGKIPSSFFFHPSEALFPPLFSQFPRSKKEPEMLSRFSMAVPTSAPRRKKMLLLLLAAWLAVAAVTARDFLSPLSEAINYSGAGREGN